MGRTSAGFAVVSCKCIDSGPPPIRLAQHTVVSCNTLRSVRAVLLQKRVLVFLVSQLSLELELEQVSRRARCLGVPGTFLGSRPSPSVAGAAA